MASAQRIYLDRIKEKSRKGQTVIIDAFFALVSARENACREVVEEIKHRIRRPCRKTQFTTH
jgi:hypothetical protein